MERTGEQIHAEIDPILYDFPASALINNLRARKNMPPLSEDETKLFANFSGGELLENLMNRREERNISRGADDDSEDFQDENEPDFREKPRWTKIAKLAVAGLAIGGATVAVAKVADKPVREITGLVRDFNESGSDKSITEAQGEFIIGENSLHDPDSSTNIPAAPTAGERFIFAKAEDSGGEILVNARTGEEWIIGEGGETLAYFPSPNGYADSEIVKKLGD
jgi:hypothetical protein